MRLLIIGLVGAFFNLIRAEGASHRRRIAPKVRLARGIVAEPPKRHPQVAKPRRGSGAKVMERIARREEQAAHQVAPLVRQCA